MTRLAPIALIGFGEVGQILAEDLLSTTVGRVAVYDTAFDGVGSANQALVQWQADHSSAYLVTGESPLSLAGCASKAVRGARLVVSAVTAAETLNAARSVVAGLSPGAFYLDLNSCAPGQKRAAADAVEGAGGRYVDAAVITPIAPMRMATPMLLGGPHAAAFAELARPLGFRGAQVFSAEVGQAVAVQAPELVARLAAILKDMDPAR